MPAFYHYLNYSVLNALKERLLNSSLGDGTIVVDSRDLTTEEIERATKH